MKKSKVQKPTGLTNFATNEYENELFVTMERNIQNAVRKIGNAKGSTADNLIKKTRRAVGNYYKTVEVCNCD